jgi:hypothetical protein
VSKFNKTKQIGTFKQHSKRKIFLPVGPIGVPLLLSNPHFLFADPKYPSAFDGISEANDDLHNTKVWLDPITGIELKANQRLQFNANLVSDSRIESVQQEFISFFFSIVFLNFFALKVWLKI